jgi:type IV pilus assembly protein PilX
MKRQDGVSLILVMVVMVVLMLGALAAVRSNETAALTAGNSAFREATKQAADVGVAAGFAYISTLASPDTGVSNQYFNKRQTEDSYGMPSTVDWSKVASASIQNYNIQWVVERMCSVSPVTDSINQCITDSQPASGSNKLGAEAYTAPATTVYRVTVRTTGPKNAESYTQALMSR